VTAGITGQRRQPQMQLVQALLPRTPELRRGCRYGRVGAAAAADGEIPRDPRESRHVENSASGSESLARTWKRGLLHKH